MTSPQLYSSKKNAQRAAIVHFGRLAAEGSHFEIKREKQPNGMFRFYYTAVTGAPGAAEATAKALEPPVQGRMAGKPSPHKGHQQAQAHQGHRKATRGHRLTQP